MRQKLNACHVTDTKTRWGRGLWQQTPCRSFRLGWCNLSMWLRETTQDCLKRLQIGTIKEKCTQPVESDHVKTLAHDDSSVSARDAMRGKQTWHCLDFLCLAPGSCRDNTHCKYMCGVWEEFTDIFRLWMQHNMQQTVTESTVTYLVSKCILGWGEGYREQCIAKTRLKSD